MSNFTIRALLDAPTGPGTVTWIGLRPARRAPLCVVTDAVLNELTGLEGDRYAGSSGTRQVSLIAQEDIAAIAAFLGRDHLPPSLLRRNIVTSGINPMALKGRRFRLGTALLETTGECHPCSRMEETLGIGGYNAVRGHGGILARVIAAGLVSLGDAVVPADQSPCASSPHGSGAP